MDSWGDSPHAFFGPHSSVGRSDGFLTHRSHVRVMLGVPIKKMPYKNKYKQREFGRIWIKKRREVWLNENGPCVKCGSWGKLEVDHINPLIKIDHKVWSWREEKRLEELSKCQVLCKNCHREKTNEYRRGQLTHGTINGYKTHKCRCRLCKNSNNYRSNFSRRAIKNGIWPSSYNQLLKELEINDTYFHISGQQWIEALQRLDQSIKGKKHPRGT